MKLKTRMEGPYPTVNVDICGVLGTTRIRGDDERHDVAAAHALMQALREPINPTYLFHGEQYRDSLLGRALDLMEAWGYSEE